MTDIFVTGTDTNVGKTVVSSILSFHMQREYWKPIQCGLENDSEYVKQFQIITHKESYNLKSPLSPNIAAEIDKINIDINQIKRPDTKSNLIIEGAGGLLVPINDKYLIVDLIQKLNIPTILVARSTLGTINHTLLSIEAMKSRDINLLGIIFNGEKNKAIEKTIFQHSKVPIFGNINFTHYVNFNWIKSAKHKNIVNKISN